MKSYNGNSLEKLIGNEPFKQGVRALCERGRMTHSWLLSGTKGVGVGFAARSLAADILYPEGGAQALALVRGECCVATSGAAGDKIGKIETGVVREVVTISPEGAADTIKVSQIRAMRSEIVHSGLTATGRAVIIYGAEKMQVQAANALLKILEEPPEGVTFILTTTSVAAVLPTIRSRTAHFVIAPVSTEQAVQFCEKQGISREIATELAKIFAGCIGEILAVAKEKKRTSRLLLAKEIAEFAHEKDTYAVAVKIATFEKDRQAARAFLEDLISLASAGMRESGVCALEGTQAVRAIRCAQKACEALGRNVNTKVVLTNFAIELCK